MTQSVISYQFDTLNRIITPAAPVVLPSAYGELTGPGALPINPASFETKKRPKKYLKKADNYYLNKKFQQATTYYRRSGLSFSAPSVTIRLADAYQKLHLPDQAIPLYESLIAKDSTNAFLYFQLAKCYQQKENYHAACQEITRAHLYNRNQPEYLDSLRAMYQANGWTFLHQDFIPLYDIQPIADTSVHIKANVMPWMAYSSCKAIWAYEPGYKEQMSTVSAADPRIIEEKECLFNVLLGYEQLDAKVKTAFPELHTLSKVLSDKRVNDFILYEISLRQSPTLAAGLGNDRIRELVNYIYIYRVSKNHSSP